MPPSLPKERSFSAVPFVIRIEIHCITVGVKQQKDHFETVWQILYRIKKGSKGESLEDSNYC